MLDHRKALRTVQVIDPAVSEIKYFLQFNTRKWLRRPFEADFRFLNHFAPDPNTEFLDIGANRAQSAQAMRLFNTKNRIHCFEPGSKTFGILKKYSRGLPNVVLHRTALSNRVSELTLFTPVYRGYVFDGLASTVREEAEEWINSERVYFFDPARLKISSESVPVMTLDSLGFNPSFVKIDVQGGELRVLEGAVDTIRRCKPLFLLESPTEETGFLAQFGYQPYRLEGKALRANEQGALNTFFIPPERLAEIRMEIR